MDQEKFVIGIDVSKSELETVVLKGKNGKSVIKARRTFKNKADGIENLLSWALSKCKSNDSVHFVLEATGIYHENLTYYLFNQGEKVSVVVPSNISFFAKSFNVKTKTDKTDAVVIARYGMERVPKPWRPATKNLHHIRNLSRQRNSYVKQRTKVSNQIHALEHSYGDEMKEYIISINKEIINGLNKAITQIEDKIEELTNNDPVLLEKVELLKSIPGIGSTTALTIISETNGFDNFTSIKRLVSFAGLDVVESQSGVYAGRTRISKKGNSSLRSALYMPAMSAVQCNKPMIALYQRINEKNPHTRQKGLVAIMRKILILSYTLWKKNEQYNPMYEWNIAK